MKQMWDKKILVKLIEDEAKITVDDALSDTSKNPVENRVINEAILGGLPDPLEQEGKVLGLDESGKLIWVEAGSSLYQHNITLKWDVSAGAVSQKFRVNLILLTSNDTPYTNVTALETYIKSIISESASGVYWPQLIVNGIEISTTDSFATVHRAILVGLGIQTGSTHVNFYGYKIDQDYGDFSYSFLSSYTLVKDVVIQIN